MAEQTVKSNDLASGGAEAFANSDLARFHWADVWNEELLTPLRAGMAHSALCEISDLLSALQTLLESGEAHAQETACALLYRRMSTLTTGAIDALIESGQTPEAIHERLFGGAS